MMEDRVDPELRFFLGMMPQENFDKDMLVEIRTASGMMSGLASPTDEQVLIYSKLIHGPAAEKPNLRVRIYEPAEKTANRPGIVYIHGGGYILGTPEVCDAVCLRMVKELGCVVVSVDYRLAPEHPFPEPLEDCYAALSWLVSNAGSLNVDSSRIAITGGSAGGGLTAALALLARDRGGPAIAFQAPLYPMLDDRCCTPSSREFVDPRVWSREKNLFGWEMYLGDAYGKDEVSYLAAPARAADLSGLPPTYTFVGELDLFRDETIDYVTRLLQAGVPTEFHIYPGCFHAFDMFPEFADVGRRAENDYIRALKSALLK